MTPLAGPPFFGRGTARTDTDAPGAGQDRAAGRLIPGIGHPFHKSVDLRSPRLIQIARETGFERRHVALIQEIAELAGQRKGRPLPASATGVLGALCCEMGLDWRICRGLGVMARADGIVRHLLEEGRQPIARRLWLETKARATRHLKETK